MRCSVCNRELDESTGKCAFCAGRTDENVRVMSPEEKSQYQGVTIDTTENDRGERRQYGGARQNTGFYVKQIRLGRSNWLTKLAIMVALAAIAAFVLFIALPVVLICVSVGVVIWIVLSFLQR